MVTAVPAKPLTESWAGREMENNEVGVGDRQGASGSSISKLQ